MLQVWYRDQLLPLKINEYCFHVASLLLDVSSMYLRLLVDAICSISSTCTIKLTMLSINIFRVCCIRVLWLFS